MLDLGIAAFGNDLVVAWRGFGADEQLYYSSLDRSNWSAPAVIPGVSSAIGPSLAEFNGRLYAAWRGSGTDQQLWYSSFDGSSWAPQANIPGVSSAIGPTLRVAFGGRLYAAWKGFGTDQQLWYSSFDGSSWAPQANIPGATSYVGASLTVFQDNLYAAWRTNLNNAGQQQLDYSAFVGPSGPGGGWSQADAIPGTVTNVLPPPPPPPPTGQHVYTIAVDADTFVFGGSLNIQFYPYGSTPGGTPLVTFKGAFGGLITPGSGLSWGTAWLNYDVEWLAQQGWHAIFEANFVPAAVNVNLWGLHGENIGNTASGGESGVLGFGASQGFFYLGG